MQILACIAILNGESDEIAERRTFPVDDVDRERAVAGGPDRGKDVHEPAGGDLGVPGRPEQVTQPGSPVRLHEPGNEAEPPGVAVVDQLEHLRAVGQPPRDRRRLTVVLDQDPDIIICGVGLEDVAPVVFGGHV